MSILLKTKSIYFNDVNLIPNLGKVKSRKEIPNELYRVIVSPMVSVVGPTFVKEAAKLGLSICTPRFLDLNSKLKLIDIFEQNKINKDQISFLSIGLNESIDTLININKYSPHHNILFDFANGYVPQIQDCVQSALKTIEFIDNLMIGNVVTGEGIFYLSKLYSCCNNDLFIRVGIGNGKPCSSSDVAGINRGQITELMECDTEKRNVLSMASRLYKTWDKNVNLVSDGGISKSGFALKAFGAGANYVLMGSYFSKALEAETHISGDGTYFGCASDKQNKLAGLDKHSEGKVINIDKEELKSLEYLVKELWGGISSGVSYVGHSSLSDFIGNGIFEEKCNSLPPKNRT